MRGTIKKLIINADDLGYTRGINSADARCSREGWVRSATIMANGGAFDDAVAMIKRNERLSVGVHLVLTELQALSPPGEISGLIDGMGCLPATPIEVMALIHSGRVSRAMICREFDRQVSRVMDCGIVPTHLDTHKHVHLHPEVLAALIAVACKYSIGWVRNPFEGGSWLQIFSSVGKGQRTAFLKQHMEAKMAGVFRPSFYRQVLSSGLRTPDYFHGVSMTGIWNEAALTSLLENLPCGVNEWMVHPGGCDADLQKLPTRLLKQREIERDLLTSPLLADLLCRHNIVLTSYGEEAA